MSRTYRKGYIERYTNREIRRVRCSRDEQPYSDYSVSGSYHWDDYFVYPNSPNYKRLLAFKTKDGADRTGPPRDFVRCYNKTHRSRFRQEAHRFLAGVADDICFDERHRHSALWDWW